MTNTFEYSNIWIYRNQSYSKYNHSFCIRKYPSKWVGSILMKIQVDKPLSRAKWQSHNMKPGFNKRRRSSCRLDSDGTEHPSRASLEHPRLRIGRKIPKNLGRKTGRSFTAFPSPRRERRTDTGRRTPTADRQSFAGAHYCCCKSVLICHIVKYWNEEY